MSSLTIPDVNTLSVILDAASRSARVRWLDQQTSEIRLGTARHIVSGPDPSEWGFSAGDYDVREKFLRITTEGWDITLSVRDLMVMVARGEFVIDTRETR